MGRPRERSAKQAQGEKRSHCVLPEWRDFGETRDEPEVAHRGIRPVAPRPQGSGANDGGHAALGIREGNQARVGSDGCGGDRLTEVNTGSRVRLVEANAGEAALDIDLTRVCGDTRRWYDPRSLRGESTCIRAKQGDSNREVTARHNAGGKTVYRYPTPKLSCKRA